MPQTTNQAADLAVVNAPISQPGSKQASASAVSEAVSKPISASSASKAVSTAVSKPANAEVLVQAISTPVAETESMKLAKNWVAFFFDRQQFEALANPAPALDLNGVDPRHIGDDTCGLF